MKAKCNFYPRHHLLHITTIDFRTVYIHIVALLRSNEAIEFGGIEPDNSSPDAKA